MKFGLASISFLLFSNLVFSQTEIDSGNYFSYYSYGENLKGEKLSTKWLDIDDVAPIILEEMKKAGYNDACEYYNYQYDSIHKLKLTAYCKKSNFGFLFIEIRSPFPSKGDRNIRSAYKKNVGVDYIEKIENPSGKITYYRIKTLPSNIFTLNEDCYWYQFTENPNDREKLVSKEVAIKILRQDIRKRLEKASKP